MLAGCANEPIASPFQQPVAHLGAIAATSDAPAGDTIADAGARKKTVASKVLSAMAFERVTGLKADPARLLEAE